MTLSEIQAILDAELARSRAEVVALDDAGALEALERSLTGKRSPLSEVHQAIKSLPP
jgi:hypothetical protein